MFLFLLFVLSSVAFAPFFSRFRSFIQSSFSVRFRLFLTAEFSSEKVTVSCPSSAVRFRLFLTAEFPEKFPEKFPAFFPADSPEKFPEKSPEMQPESFYLVKGTTFYLVKATSFYLVKGFRHYFSFRSAESPVYQITPPADPKNTTAATSCPMFCPPCSHHVRTTITTITATSASIATANAILIIAFISIISFCCLDSGRAVTLPFPLLTLLTIRLSPKPSGFCLCAHQRTRTSVPFGRFWLGSSAYSTADTSREQFCRSSLRSAFRLECSKCFTYSNFPPFRVAGHRFAATSGLTSKQYENF